MDPIDKIRKDVREVGRTLSRREIRYLVHYYYMAQDDRMRAHNQVRALDKSEEPNAVVMWLADQARTIENELKKVLNDYTTHHPMGEWMRSIYGIGPVISAGLLAHIDIEKAPTVGHIWRFAGLDPTLKWGKGQKRPFNAKLKTICWKAGQSFIKFHNREECYYGRIYAERKAYEIERNESGGNAGIIASDLANKRYKETTDAHKHLLAGRLPPSQIDARASRYAVKLFLSHLHGVWYKQHFNEEPPLPYPIAHLGHAHMIEAPTP